MSYGKVLGVLAELISWAKASYAKSEKEKYENERKNSPSAPADSFESSFGSGGLRDDSKLRTNQTDHGDRQ